MSVQGSSSSSSGFVDCLGQVDTLNQHYEEVKRRTSTFSKSPSVIPLTDSAELNARCVTLIRGRTSCFDRISADIFGPTRFVSHLHLNAPHSNSHAKSFKSEKISQHCVRDQSTLAQGIPCYAHRVSCLHCFKGKIGHISNCVSS